MSSDQQATSCPSLDTIKRELGAGTLTEISYPRLELKSKWNTDHGRNIAAIANHESCTGGWLVVGVNDKGHLTGEDKAWCEKNYEKIGNQINQFLDPMQAVKDIHTESFDGSYCIMLEIKNPGNVTKWSERAYKQAGSSVAEMRAGEQTALAMRLPGDDYSALPWQGEVNDALVLDFANKVIEKGSNDFPTDLSSLSSSQILQIMRLDGKMAAGILFGDVTVQIAHYDADDQVASNVMKKGLYTILSDSFIDQIQTTSERKGATVEGNSTSLKEHLPYPPKLLREILANAVAHALYQRWQGEIIVDIHLDRVTVRNNAPLEAEVFAEQWFSQQTMTKNQLLMETLRTAGITDKIGTGKANVFRLAMEAGKEEPSIDFLKINNFAKWRITVYNSQRHEHIDKLLAKLTSSLPTPQHARVATALVLWKDHKWSAIKTRLDDHYRKIADEVTRHDDTPVVINADQLFVRRWAEVALKGQSSKGFTPSEEDMIMRILAEVAYNNSSRQISTPEARRIIGLGRSQSEASQLSNLFRKWQKTGLVENVKRGIWQFNVIRFEQGGKQASARGSEMSRHDIATRMLTRGMPEEQILDVLQLSVEQLEKIKRQIKS